MRADKILLASNIARGSLATSQIQKGCLALTRAVGATLGPRGRTVVIDPYTASQHQDPFSPELKPVITKDGVTVSEHLHQLPTNLQAIGGKIIHDAASRANEETGDGTSTTQVLAGAILQEGRKLLHGETFFRNIDVRRGINKAVRQVTSLLEQSSMKIEGAEDVFKIARVSSNQDDHIASIIRDIYSSIGLKGAVSIEDGPGTGTHSLVEFSQGLKLDSGFLSPYFADDRQAIDYVGTVYLALVDGVVRTEADVVNFLEFAKVSKRPLLILAEEFESEALTCLVVNRLQQGLKIAAVKTPLLDGSDIIEDIAFFSGATVIGREFDLEYEKISRVDPVEVVGKVERAVLTSTETVLTAFDSSEVEARVGQRVRDLQAELDTNVLLGDFDRDQILERMGRLQGGVATIKAGGVSAVEIGECRHRIEDALFAVQASLDEGYVTGGGFAMLRASTLLEDQSENEFELLGQTIVKNACAAPASVILQNRFGEAGKALRIIYDYKTYIQANPNDLTRGFNCHTNDWENLVESGVIDPLKTARSAILYASGASSLLLSGEVSLLARPQSEHEIIRV